jgi:thioredoxin 1
MFGPVMDKIADDIPVTKVDVDENAELKERYGVMSVPTVVKLEDGVEVNRIVGAVGYTAMLAKLNA